MIDLKAIGFGPLFHLGKLVMTDGVADLIDGDPALLLPYLNRHARGDWGELDEHDKAVNKDALRRGHRLMSVYHLPSGQVIWIITDRHPSAPDDSVTTFLLPDEY